MFQKYFKYLYQRTMSEAYSLAHREIINSLKDGGDCLDCGASRGQKYNLLKEAIDFPQGSYYGIEWNENLLLSARESNLHLIKGDLNKEFVLPDNKFKCVLWLYVL